MATQMEKAPSKQDGLGIWRPWADMDQLRSEMFDMMNGMFRRNLASPEFGPAVFEPTLKLYKDNSNLMAELAVPGMERDDINLQVTRDTLTISGEYKKEETTKKEQVFRSEMHYGSFHRSIQLPMEVDTSKVKAQLKNGVLHITMPMTNPERLHQVKIDVK